ncbi:MAG: cytochrome c peroxidase [Enterobacteriaceae bacterium]
MSKKWFIRLFLLVILVYLACVITVYFEDQQRAKKLMLSAQVSDHPIYNLFVQKGCDYCHTTSASMPLYASLPIAKQLMQYDVELGNRYFNLQPVLQQIEQQQPVSEVDLAKIESVIEHDEMPPLRYLVMHWGGKLDRVQKKQILDWVKQQRAKLYTPSLAATEHQNAQLQPLPDAVPVNMDKVKLGFQLYHDVRLSGDNTLSCASCHSLKTGGVDNEPTSLGINGQRGGINAPTVFNSVFNIKQFWDGRAHDLQEQAGGPPLNPVEMGSTSWQEIITKLQADPQLSLDFIAVYPDGFSADNLTDAIAEFEKTLLTPNSPVDRYLKGETTALTAQQQRGYQLFVANKCATCHTGMNIGGQSFELMGRTADYFAERGKPVTEDDQGRFNVTHNPADKYHFKTPTLRNIQLTAPYMHDASAATLEQAVEMMLKYQVGKQLPPEDVKDIVLFLEAMTGEYNPVVQ